MVKITLNPMIKSARGKFGDVIFRRTHTGEFIATKLPDMSNVVWSEAQQAQRERFREAVAYAREAMADPKVRAKYEKLAKKANKRPYDLAKSDFFKGKNLLKGRSK
jgi:hypothetical protein